MADKTDIEKHVRAAIVAVLTRTPYKFPAPGSDTDPFWDLVPSKKRPNGWESSLLAWPFTLEEISDELKKVDPAYAFQPEVAFVKETLKITLKLIVLKIVDLIWQQISSGAGQ